MRAFWSFGDMYTTNHRDAVGGIPFALGFHFVRCGCASYLREEMRYVRDLLNLPKSERIFRWFSHLVNS
jgi:hypothetical protein